MKKEVLIAAAITVATVGSAYADFYVVEDQSTHRCTIVNQEPRPGTMNRTVGDDSFRSQQEAENAMRSALACANTPMGGGPGSTTNTTNVPAERGTDKCGSYLAAWPCRR
jgi:hypothetical protein